MCTMYGKILAVMQAAFRRAFLRGRCFGEEWGSWIPFQMGSRRASLRHADSDHDLAVQFPDGQYALRGGFVWSFLFFRS